MFQVKKAVVDYFLSAGAGNTQKVVVCPPVLHSDWSRSRLPSSDWLAGVGVGRRQSVSLTLRLLDLRVVRGDISADTVSWLTGRLRYSLTSHHYTALFRPQD